MADKISCPNCGKSHEREDYDFQWNKTGRKGKCKSCGKSVYLTRDARGFIKNKDGSVRRRFKNA